MDCIVEEINSNNLEEINNRNLDEINSIYRNYINDPKYVYKSCQGEWIVILEKLDETITNELNGKPDTDKFRGVVY